MKNYSLFNRWISNSITSYEQEAIINECKTMTTLKCMQHKFCQLCGVAIIINKNIKSPLSLRAKQIHGLKN